MMKPPTTPTIAYTHDFLLNSSNSNILQIPSQTTTYTMQLKINPIIIFFELILNLLQNYDSTANLPKHLLPFVRNMPLVVRNESYFFPNNVFSIAFPIFRSNPALDIGMPVSRAIFCFACVMPSARFSEKLRPGRGVDFLFIATNM